MASLLADPKLLKQATPDLNDLTYFNNRSYGGISQEEVDSGRAQNLLNNIHKYDSDARFNPTYNSDGNLTGYQLQFDPSKLPGPGKEGPLGGSNPSNNGSYSSGSGFMPRFSTVQEHMNLAHPELVANTDHYGRVTDNRNIYDKTSLLDILGPLAVAGFGGVLGGFGGLGSLARGIPQGLNRMSHTGFNPFQLGGMALPFIPGVSPFMSTLGRIGLNTLGGK